MYTESRSRWWYILPIFGGIVGAIIAYIVIRKDDPKKANRCVYVGFITTVLGIPFYLLNLW